MIPYLSRGPFYSTQSVGTSVDDLLGDLLEEQVILRFEQESSYERREAWISPSLL